MINENIKSVYRNIKRIVSLVWRTDKSYLLVITIITLIFSMTPAISLVLMQNIINLIQNRDLTFSIFGFITIYVGVELLCIFIQGFQGYFNTKFNLKFNLAVKQLILDKACSLKLSDYENSEIYNKIKRAEYESDGKLILFLNSFISLFGLFITFLSFLYIILKFRFWIACTILLLPIIKFAVMNKFNKKQFNYLVSRTDDEREAWYYNHLLISGDSFKELKLFNLFEHFKNKYVKLIQNFNSKDLELNKELTVKITLLETIEQLINGIIFTYIVSMGLKEILLIGDVVTYTKSSISTKDQFQSILRLCASIFKDNLYINQLFDFLDIKENQTGHSSAVVIDSIEEIRLENLYYRYSKSSNYVLKNINLTLRRNEFYTIVGKNGSGKSTLAKLIMGLYEEYDGTIYINGVDLKQVDKESYLKKIGALMQDFTKYAGTIRENIAFGNLKFYSDDKYLLRVSDKFRMKSFILEESEQLETQLGFWFKSGKQISIGQWQKIALSRAFIKSGDLYVLDEPNAALDPISEYEIAGLYSELLSNKIGIIIAHKFNNFIHDADSIIVIENGEVVGQGSHKALLAKCEIYSQLYNLQIQNEDAVNIECS